ncbi:MAG: archaellin/type IV pilin N-terminal domain-containing protein [Candidatus Thorarchaeota archaeon]
MNLNKLFGRKQAVSPVVAAILLIGLTVAAGAIVYFIVLPMLSSTTEADDIAIVFDGNQTSVDFKFRVKNEGATDVTVSSISITGADSGVTISAYDPSTKKVKAGETTLFTITTSTVLTSPSQIWDWSFTGDDDFDMNGQTFTTSGP